MATSFPTFALTARKLSKTVVGPRVLVSESINGKEVRDLLGASNRYRYVISVEALTATERTNLATFLSTVKGKSGLITYTDPETSGSVSCRLDDDVDYDRLSSDYWGGMTITLITVL